MNHILQRHPALLLLALAVAAIAGLVTLDAILDTVAAADAAGTASLIEAGRGRP